MKLPQEVRHKHSVVVVDYSSSPASSFLSVLLTIEDIGFVIVKSLHEYSSPRNNTDVCFVFVVDPTTDIERHIHSARRRFKTKPILIVSIGPADQHSHDTIHTIADTYDVDYSIYEEVNEIVVDRIRSFYRSTITHNENNPPIRRTPRKVDLGELANRIDLAVDAISDLRINSTSGPVSELRKISNELREERFSSGRISISHFDDRLNNTLHSVAKLYDFIENSRMASIVVCGATTAILGCSGINAVMCMGLTLAAWQGQDAYLEALSRVFSKNGKAARKN